MELENEIKEIIKSIINIPLEHLDVKENLRNLGIDSITFEKILIRIEDQFRVEFSDSHLMLIDGNIKDLCNIIIEIKEKERCLRLPYEPFQLVGAKFQISISKDLWF